MPSFLSLSVALLAFTAQSVRVVLIEALRLHRSHHLLDRMQNSSTMIPKRGAAFMDPLGILSDTDSSSGGSPPMLERYFAEFLLPIPRPDHVDSDVKVLHEIATMHSKFHLEFGEMFLPEYPLAHVKLTTSYPATDQIFQDRMLSFDRDYHRFKDAGVSVSLVRGGVGASEEEVNGTRTVNFMYNLPSEGSSKRNVTILEEMTDHIRMELIGLYRKWRPAFGDEGISKLTPPVWEWSGNRLSLFSVGIPHHTTKKEIINMDMRSLGKHLGQLGEMLTPTFMERIVSDAGASQWVLHRALDRDLAFLSEHRFRPSEALFRVGGIPYPIEDGFVEAHALATS